MCRFMAFIGSPVSLEDVERFYKVNGVTNRDASGYLLILEDRAIMQKAPVRGELFIAAVKNVMAEYLPKARAGMFHCRLATNGTPSFNGNNHPIVYKRDNRLVGAIVHNGVVRPPYQLPSTGQTDTEQLLLHYLVNGAQSWNKFTGYGAVAMWIRGKFLVFRDGAPLYYKVTTKGGVIFTQTIETSTGWLEIPQRMLFKVKDTQLQLEAAVGFEKEWWYGNLLSLGKTSGNLGAWAGSAHGFSGVASRDKGCGCSGVG